MTRLARALSENGHAIEMVVATDTGPFREACGPLVPVVVLGGRGALAATLPLARYLHERRPRTLLVTLEHTSLAAVAARAFASPRTRLVVRQANNPTTQRPGSRKDAVVSGLLRATLRRADFVAAVSKGVADDVAGWARLRPERVRALPNPLVDDDVAQLASEPIDHRFFADDRTPVVLAAGRLTPQKDVATLLRAFAALRVHQAARLIVLGEGPERATLEALAQELGVADDVDFPGFAANPFAYMRRASVFALSSAWEGLPGVLVQAMACGCPVVATDCRSGPREILADGAFGTLVPVGDPVALAAALAQTLAEPIDAATLSRRAAAYSVDAARRAYEEVLWPLRT